MERLFLNLLNRSIAGGWMILAVMALRPVFRRMPKNTLCLLWALVALRLVCPFSLESGLSLIPSPQTVPEEILYAARPEIHSGLEPLDSALNPLLEQMLAPGEPGNSVNPIQIWIFVLSRIWLGGTAVLLIYAMWGWLRLRKRVAAAIPVRQNIRRCEFIDTPFVMGLVMPVIYLPAGLEKKTWDYVLAHEQAHVERRDHWWKAVGYLIASFYWFQPLVWVGYSLLCRDMEGACDEKAIENMDEKRRKEYARALLEAGSGLGAPSGPLAFGEVGLKSRIRSVMAYRKPGRWTAWVCAAAVIAVAAGFLTDPLPVYDPEAVYAQETLRDPEYIKVDVDGADRVFEKDSPVYTALMEQLRKNWWLYTEEGLDTAPDEALVRPVAPEVLKTKSWRTYREVGDTILCLCYPSEPLLWENADGSELLIGTLAFVLPEKSWSEESTRGFFIIAETEQIGVNEGICTYYYTPALTGDFWGFVVDANRK